MGASDKPTIVAGTAGGVGGIESRNSTGASPSGDGDRLRDGVAILVTVDSELVDCQR